MPDQDRALLLALTARIPPAGIAAFQAYEAQVLPLLGMHGGSLQRRLRNDDGTVEVHSDLQSARYLAMGLRNDQPKVYERIKRDRADFTPAGLRGIGTR